MDDLRSELGDLTLEQLFVIPRNARMVDASAGARWVVTPTEVLAVGADRLAVWMDDAGRSRIRALIPFSDVIAISDRTVLLYGRLELVCRDESVVVRYNTVGRPELRVLLEPLRATAGSPEAVPAGTGASLDALPHKWMALTRSRDVQPSGPGPVVVAPGELDSPASILHSGIVILTGRELIVATDPTPDVQLPQYGFDLLVVARSRVLGLEGDGAAVRVVADAAPGRLDIAVDAHPSVVAGAVQVVGPLVAAGLRS